MTFTPGSDRSLAQKFGLFVLFVLGLFIPVVLLFGTMTRWLNGALSWFVESSYNMRFADYHNDFWGVILPFLLYGILLITVFTIALVSVIGITRFIKSIIESR